MTPKKAPNKVQKATKPSAKARVAIPQPHGGALVPGAGGGRANGLLGGRPRNEVRAKLLHIVNGKGIGFLDKVMDGEVDVRFFGSCPKCKHRVELPEDDEYMEKILDHIGDQVHASVDHRIRANDQALKYGLGTLKEVSVEQVRERVEKTIAVIRAHVSPAQVESILSDMRPIWA